MIETRIFSCLEAIKPQSSPRPLSFLKTSPKFASSAPLEVADETRDFDSTSTFCVSFVRMGTNNWSLERGQPRRSSTRTFTNGYSVIGATPRQETLLRAQIQV